MTDEEDIEIARVTMQWPQELKERVRGVAGGRAMTKYVIEAVEARLDGQSINDTQRKELWDARFLAQQLADALAMAGDYEDRVSVLRGMDLPPWIETSGWSEETAEVVPIKPLPEIHPDDIRTEAWGDPDEHAPIPAPFPGKAENEVVLTDTEVDNSGPDIASPQVSERIEEPAKSHSNDLFQRLKAAAAAKGVDVSGVDLKPASEVKVLSDDERAAKGVQVSPKDAEELARGKAPDDAIPPTPFVAIPDDGLSHAVSHHIVDGQVASSFLDGVEVDAHNHSWTRMEDPHGLFVGQAYVCDCGASMDKERVYAFGEAPEPKAPAEVPSTEAPATATGRCVVCQDELIDGECWTCM